MIKNLQEKLSSDLVTIKREMRGLNELEEKCKELKDKQSNMIDKINDIMQIQVYLRHYVAKIKSMKDNEASNPQCS